MNTAKITLSVDSQYENHKKSSQKSALIVPLSTVHDQPVPPELEQCLVEAGYRVASKCATIGDLALNITSFIDGYNRIMGILHRDAALKINELLTEIAQLRAALIIERRKSRPW